MARLNSSKLAFLLITFVAVLLAVIWFRNGMILGSGESALPFNNLDRYREITNYVWNDANLGGYLGNTMGSAPTYSILAAIFDFGIPGFVIEASVFAALIIIAGMSVYMLVRQLLPDAKPDYIIISVFYYVFNPMSLVNVWNRFLLNYMFFWALLPLFLLLIIKGIRTKALVYGIYASLAATIMSYALSNPAFSILLWALTVLTLSFFMFTERKGKFFYAKYFVITLISFFVFNLWWISQNFGFLVTSSYKDSVSAFFTEKGNLGTLTTLSSGLGRFSNTFRLVHSAYVEKGPVWAGIYGNPIIALFEYSIPIIVLWTIYKFKRSRSILFIGGGYLLSLFIVKGNSQPFGGLFEVIFLKLPFSQVFRNPFEKFGFLLALFTTLAVGFGLQKIVENIGSPRAKKLVTGAVSILVFGLYGFPYWTGLVFTSNEGVGQDNLRSYEVEVPSYYAQADKWLHTRSQTDRFISFPLDGEGMTYTWEKPFLGVDLSSALFRNPNISLNTTVPYYSDVASNVEKLSVYGDKLVLVSPLINVNTVLLRRDVDWRARRMMNPDLLETELNTNTNYSKVNQFGDLSIYTMNTKPSSLIYVPSWGARVEPSASLEDYLRVVDGKNGIGFMYSDSNVQFVNTADTLVKPFKYSLIKPGNNYSVQEALSSLLYARYLPDSPLHNLIVIKENIERSQVNNTDGGFIYDLTNLGKRMVELYRLVEKDADPTYVKNATNTYFADLQHNKVYYAEEFQSTVGNKFWGTVVEELTKQKVLITQAGKITSERNRILVTDALAKFNNELIEMGVQSQHTPIVKLGPKNKGWMVYRINVSEPGEYQIMLDNPRWNDYYSPLPKEFEFQLNDKTYSTKATIVGESLNLGKYEFTSGVNEVIFAEPEQLNMLTDSIDEYKLDSNSLFERTFQIDNIDPSSYYEISYDYWIKKGKSFRLNFNYDNDPPIKLDEDFFKRTISSDLYDHGFRNDSFVFAPRGGSTTLKITFTADPSNYCQDGTFLFFGSSCKDPNYSRLYNKATEVSLSNITLKKVFDNRLILLKDNQTLAFTLPSLSFVEINPTEYDITVTNANQQFALIFSQLYNSGWKASYPDGSYITEDKHFLANSYANGWVIDRTGSYKLKLKFTPQNIYDAGKTISIIFLSATVLALGFIAVRKRLNAAA